MLRQPGGGTLDRRARTGDRAAIATAAPVQQAAWLPLPSAPGSQTLTLRARGDGPVDVLAWSIARGRPGVIYANLGTIGASIDLMDPWDPAMVRQDLAHLSPSMIVLAFGTNEGFRDSTDPTAMPLNSPHRLRELHAAAPARRCWCWGRLMAIAAGARHSAPARLRQSELDRAAQARTRSERRSAGRRAQDAYFWDWQAAMGGPCSMLRWAATEPPIAAPDHVHLFAPGYQATAEALFREIMDGYERYRALRPQPDAVPDARLPAVLHGRAGIDGAACAHARARKLVLVAASY